MKKSSNELLNVSNEDYKPNNDIVGGSKQAETTKDTIILDNVKSSQSKKSQQWCHIRMETNQYRQLCKI